MSKKRIFAISIKYLEFCDQHHSQWTDDFRFTVGAGGQVAARFQNANGVILELVGAQLGLAVSLGSTGMTIALQAQ